MQPELSELLHVEMCAVYMWAEIWAVEVLLPCFKGLTSVKKYFVRKRDEEHFGVREVSRAFTRKFKVPAHKHKIYDEKFRPIWGASEGHSALNANP